MGWYTNTFDYFRQNYIEIIATLFSIIYIFYSVRENKLMWIFGLFSSAIYVYICFKARIYADMGINAYYVFVSIYGWIHWTLFREHEKKDIPTTTMTNKQWIWVILAIAVLFAGIGLFLDYFTNSDIAYWDAFTTSASIVATWMLARKILENWLIWIIVDGVSVFLYTYKELYSTSGLFLVYTIMAIIGFNQWKKNYKASLEKI